jgi:hypothetical protein
MKNLIPFLFTACIAFCNLNSFAQNAQKSVPLNDPDYNRPKLFSDLPDKINFDPGKFSNLFELQPGQSADIMISPGFNFTGNVISRSVESKVSSVIISSTSRPGARIIFTKVTGENNSIRYAGRIISMKHSDSYEIVSENNQYYFKKKGIYDLMSE